MNFDVDVSNHSSHQHRFQITFHKVNTQPSDPYNSMKVERELSASLILTTEMPLTLSAVEEDVTDASNTAANGGGGGGGGGAHVDGGGGSDSGGGGGILILSNIEGELHVKFKELKEGTALQSESINESFVESFSELKT